MKRRASIFIVLALAVGGVTALPGRVAANPPAEVTIAFTDSFARPLPDCSPAGCSFHGRDFTSPLIATGSFSTSGAISDTGSVTSSFVHAARTAHIERTLSGAHGDVIASAEAVVRSVDGGIVTFSGNWLIKGGTGAYVGLHGEGQLTMLLDLDAGTATETWSGVAH